MAHHVLALRRALLAPLQLHLQRHLARLLRWLCWVAPLRLSHLLWDLLHRLAPLGLEPPADYVEQGDLRAHVGAQ